MLEHQLCVGRTYRFTFKSEFERHGVCTTSGMTCLHKGGGVFTLRQISTFKDIVLNGVNLYKSFFEPLEISKDEYSKYFNGKPEDLYSPEYTTEKVETETINYEQVVSQGQTSVVARKTVGVREQVVETGTSELKKRYLESICYGSYPIYKLQDVVDPDDIIYVPEKAIKGFPEVGVAEYQDLTLAIDIGYWDDPTKLDSALFAIRERLAAYGIQPLSVQMFSSDSAWMNKEEYNDVKKVKVPAEIVDVTFENKNSYVGSTAIINGTLKTIVDSYSDNTEATKEKEVLVNSIIHKALFKIDPQLFLRKTTNTEEVYESGKQYYRLLSGNGIVSGSLDKDGSKFLKLFEGSKSNGLEYWAPGDPLNYVQTNRFTGDTSVVTVGKTYYRDYGMQYAAIPAGTSIEELQAVLDTGTAIYRKEESYKQCQSYDPVDPDETYYKRNGGSYTAVSTPASLSNEYYTKIEGCVAVTKEYLTAHATELFYIMSKLHNWKSVVASNANKALLTSLAANGTLFIKEDTYVIDYTQDAVVDLIARKFDSVDAFGSLQTTQLTVEDIVMLGSKSTGSYQQCRDPQGNDAELVVEGVIYFKHLSDDNYQWQQINTGNALTSEYYKYSGMKMANQLMVNKYGGRWFEYFYQGTDVNYSGKIMAQVVTATNYSAYKDYTGTIIGEEGDLYTDTYIMNESMRRNYYAMYTELLYQHTILTEKCAALQTLVDNMAADLDSKHRS